MQPEFAELQVSTLTAAVRATLKLSPSAEAAVRLVLFERAGRKRSESVFGFMLFSGHTGSFSLIQRSGGGGAKAQEALGVRGWLGR